MNPLITIKVTGDQQLENLAQYLSGGMNTQAILDEGAAVLFNRMRSRFLVEQNPQGEQWPPSKAAILRKAGRGGGTLFDTGKLWRGLQLYAVGKDSRAIGENVTSKGFPYPLMHNFGLGIFPQRQFLGFGDEDVVLMSNIVVRNLVDGLQGLTG